MVASDVPAARGGSWTEEGSSSRTSSGRDSVSVPTYLGKYARLDRLGRRGLRSARPPTSNDVDHDSTLFAAAVGGWQKSTRRLLKVSGGNPAPLLRNDNRRVERGKNEDSSRVRIASAELTAEEDRLAGMLETIVW